MTTRRKNISLIDEARESLAEGAQGIKHGFKLVGRGFKFADEYMEVWGDTSLAILKDEMVAKHLNATIRIEDEIEEAKSQLEADRAERARKAQS
jgi:hypothetical protein